MFQRRLFFFLSPGLLCSFTSMYPLVDGNPFPYFNLINSPLSTISLPSLPLPSFFLYCLSSCFCPRCPGETPAYGYVNLRWQSNSTSFEGRYLGYTRQYLRSY
ncbi:hypothetical protein GGR54DRAFT_67816 [Hypoxylon sp. NC1633]|nr:hypothetical protein GGR54DRAFT_67816 [Hypoxylon sp. NC1633]